MAAYILILVGFFGTPQEPLTSVHPYPSKDACQEALVAAMNEALKPEYAGLTPVGKCLRVEKPEPL